MKSEFLYLGLWGLRESIRLLKLDANVYIYIYIYSGEMGQYSSAS